MQHRRRKQKNRRTRRTQKQKAQMSRCTFDRKAATKLDRAVFLAVMQAWAMLLRGLAALEQVWAALLSALVVSRWSQAVLSRAMAALRQTRVLLWSTLVAPRGARAASFERSGIILETSGTEPPRNAQKGDFVRQYCVFEGTKLRKVFKSL